MTNAELIKALRRCSYMTVADELNEDYCKPCAYYTGDTADVTCIDRMMIDAADALEAADKRIDGLQKLVDINTERCEALRKQLRESHENYEKHLNELEAQMPKKGEWIGHGAEDEFEYYECPLCGFIGLNYNYCPNCGAKMRTVTDCHTLEEGER